MPRTARAAGTPRPLAERVRPLLEVGNREGARSAYADYRKRHPDMWGRTTEAEINTLGYAQRLSAHGSAAASGR